MSLIGLSKINETFEANPYPVSEIFQFDNGKASFRIPLYQREYRWNKNNIYRLIEDICEGLYNFDSPTESQSLTFLGTLILVKENPINEDELPGDSLSVVDGQQRLSTLSLILCKLYEKIILLRCKLDRDDEIDSWLYDESLGVKDELFNCFVTTNPNRVVRNPYQFLPVIVREEDDRRASNMLDADYRSPLASYIFDFAEYYWKNQTEKELDAFNWQNNKKTQSHELFLERLDLIYKKIDKVINGTEKDFIPESTTLVYNDNFRKLFPELRRVYSSLIKKIRKLDDSDLKKHQVELIKILSFTNYLLERVVVTFVTCKDQNYAFEIFEALNTTGESLTAIETFKPTIIEFEKKHGGYVGSDAEFMLNDIETHIFSDRSATRQQNESKELVVQLALYSKGEKQSKKLQSQRTFLRRSFDDCSSKEAKRNFLKLLHEVVDYRKRFWDKNAFEEFTNFGKETQLCYCCLALIRDMNTSLAGPILTRYWINEKDKVEKKGFVEIVKALTAFIVLRRTYTGSTRNIDSDFRQILKKGHNNQEESTGLCTSLNVPRNVLPSLNEFKSICRSYLKNFGIENKDKWVKEVSKVPVKEYSNPLCRFLLLASSRFASSLEEGSYLLKKDDRIDINKDYLKWDIWQSEDFETVEHIAPQSRGSEKAWSDDIYTSDLSLKHTLGNLALLPKGANSAVGNASSEKKWLIYKALSSRSSEDADKFISEALNSGNRFSKRLTEIIKEGRRLPGVDGIGYSDKWTAEDIKNRSENIATLAWEEISPWLFNEEK